MSGGGAEGLADPLGVPGFLRPLAQRAVGGEDVLVTPLEDPRAPQVDRDEERRSAVLALISGTDLESAQLVLEERGHRMRSQPGQFSLPGGGWDASDADDVDTALREAREETGLEREQVRVLGRFAPIPMPWRAQRVTPVLAWAPQPPALDAQDPFEVERLVWAPLIGPGSLTDPRCRLRGRYEDRLVGPVFDLPGGAFVWGFTAMILEQLLIGLGLEPGDPEAPLRDIPQERRR